MWLAVIIAVFILLIIIAYCLWSRLKRHNESDRQSLNPISVISEDSNIHSSSQINMELQMSSESYPSQYNQNTQPPQDVALESPPPSYTSVVVPTAPGQDTVQSLSPESPPPSYTSVIYGTYGTPANK